MVDDSSVVGVSISACDDRFPSADVVSVSVLVSAGVGDGVVDSPPWVLSDAVGVDIVFP